MKFRRAAYRTRFVRVLCVEAADQHTVQGFLDTVNCDKMVTITEGLELLLDSRRGENQTVELFFVQNVEVL